MKLIPDMTAAQLPALEILMVNVTNPTPYPEVNCMLLKLLSAVQAILGSHFVGMYVYGSLAGGAFDRHSDVDFLVVTDEEISDNLFSALHAMHMQLATIDSWCAVQLDGSYIPQHALRRYDPTDTLHPHIDRGKDERLRIMQHDSDWIIQRHILREQGVVMAGPTADTLIDPVLPGELKRAVLGILRGWFARMLDNPAQLNTRGYQSYTVLTMCRMLYTLAFGTVVSKRVAAKWAQETLGEPWRPLIERAWVGRQNPQMKAREDDVKSTLDSIRYTLERTKSVTGHA